MGGAGPGVGPRALRSTPDAPLRSGSLPWQVTHAWSAARVRRFPTRAVAVLIVADTEGSRSEGPRLLHFAKPRMMTWPTVRRAMDFHAPVGAPVDVVDPAVWCCRADGLGRNRHPATDTMWRTRLGVHQRRTRLRRHPLGTAVGPGASAFDEHPPQEVTLKITVCVTVRSGHAPEEVDFSTVSAHGEDVRVDDRGEIMADDVVVSGVDARARSSISRRALLSGVSVTAASPLIEGVVPAWADSQPLVRGARDRGSFGPVTVFTPSAGSAVPGVKYGRMARLLDRDHGCGDRAGLGRDG